MLDKINILDLTLDGEIHYDSLYKQLFATDASAYQEQPDAVIYPKTQKDLEIIVAFAQEHNCPIIPRAAGTSLAGQVVGGGLVVDVSKYLNRIIEINVEEKWVRVEPGVVLDELNAVLKPYGLFFAPETSTSNRCCIGGMIGNNSCGSHSLVYGTTREHLISVEAILSDSTKVTFEELSKDIIRKKKLLQNKEGAVYRHVTNLLEDETFTHKINENFPDKRLKRRNTGYALDIIHDQWHSKQTLNMCKLIAGSEGTLCFITEAKLNLEILPPPIKALICVHCATLKDAFYANLVALDNQPVAVELMDKHILDLSADNIIQKENRFFLKGDPAAILIVELAENTEEELNAKADLIQYELELKGLGFHYPRIYGKDMTKVWSLRKAGLGLLSTMPGDAKPVSLIEDTAVLPEYLPGFIDDIDEMLARHGLLCVYHAHISVGELHIRPILNLKDSIDKKKFRDIAYETALLVKKYHGSLSGEHGDGRLRGEFISVLYGEEVYQLFRGLKKCWDEHNIFNIGKIVDTPPMDNSLRYMNPLRPDLLEETYFNFHKQRGWLRAVEQCNGAGDCRKVSDFGGTMCPTFRVTKDERFATRGRSNILRNALLKEKYGAFSDPDALHLLDECLSCKGCKSECPSNVDMARYKAEYLQHHYDAKGIPFKVYLIANLSKIQSIASIFPSLYNYFVNNPLFSRMLKIFMHFAPQRSIPHIGKYTLTHWCKYNLKNLNNANHHQKVNLFIDEFTNFLDVEIGVSFVRLMTSLGYNVIIPKQKDSGRTELSKGLLKKAKSLAKKNIELLSPVISEEAPLVGIEPSCILSFRDEYIDLVGEEKDLAENLAKNSLLYDEFICREIEQGRISRDLFLNASGIKIKLHGHCHQKSLASVEASAKMLRFIGCEVDIIPSGCCGMAGAYGYDKDKYEMSMKIGEDVLFPAIRSSGVDTIISAPGTSCRQQIKDGTGVIALHPIEILEKFLKKK